MTMSVHDACEEWAEGRLPIERALELTGAADVGELLIICYQCDVPRPMLTGPPPAEDGYPPESIGVLAGLEPRPQGVTIGTGAEFWWASIDGLAPEPVALWRDAGLCEEPPQPWGAERLGVEGVLWPDRVRLIALALVPAELPED